MGLYDKPPYVRDSNGVLCSYRLISSRLEKCKTSSGVWHEVQANEFVTMNPDELRCIADVIEGKT